MQWILQDFEDTRQIAQALEKMGCAYSWHKVVPFVGTLEPEPVVANPEAVVMFGSYSLWRFAEKRGYTPGVFLVRPFVDETPWKPFLLNGPGATFLRVADIPDGLPDDGREWFCRPVSDGKEQAGGVHTSGAIRERARKVLALPPEDIPNGSLRPDTLMIFSKPTRIFKEWRCWVVDDKIITYSLYKEGARVVYRPEIDADALSFAQDMVKANPGYARAYILDVCKTPDGLRLLETNCINAAGFYAANIPKLVQAINDLA